MAGLLALPSGHPLYGSKSVQEKANGSRAAAHKVEAPEAEEHCELPRVHTHLSALDVVQAGAPAALAEVDHADAAQRGPDVLKPNELRGSIGAEIIFDACNQS